jgi:hypothetical protein
MQVRIHLANDRVTGLLQVVVTNQDRTIIVMYVQIWAIVIISRGKVDLL